MIEKTVFDLPSGRVTYELLWAAKGEHKLFRRTYFLAMDAATSDYVIADRSGEFPHQTEDGPLVLDLTMVFEACQRASGVRVTVPCRDTDAVLGYVDAHVNLVLALKEHAQVRVSMSSALEAQVNALRGMFPALFEEEPNPFSPLHPDEKHRIITKMVNSNCGHFMTRVADAWFVGDSANRAKLERLYGSKFIGYAGI